MSRLSTHVLDTAHGKPAGGVAVTLYRVTPAGRDQVLATHTNADGRTDAPLLASDAMAVGTYELDFEAGAYFRAMGLTLPQPSFVDRVTLRFGIGDPNGDYHVPLLVSPWSYSTYRGS